MSYDLAVWDGRPPSSHAEAARVFEGLYREYLDTEDRVEPTPAIGAFLRDLLTHWPDDDPDTARQPPWSWGPMSQNAAGPILYFGVLPGHPARFEVAREVTELAGRHGLVYYDPQSELVLVPDDVRAAPEPRAGAEDGLRGLFGRLRRG